jgi:hypothetical protein
LERRVAFLLSDFVTNELLNDFVFEVVKDKEQTDSCCNLLQRSPLASDVGAQINVGVDLS